MKSANFALPIWFRLPPPLQTWGVCLCLLAVLGGCAKVEQEKYDPVDRELANSVKPSSLLADAEKSLGQPHSPSQVQIKSLSETLQRMPEQIRQNAEADRTLAWGNDHDFLVVKVNEQGTIWVVTTRFGGPRPTSPFKPTEMPAEMPAVMREHSNNPQMDLNR